MAEYRGSTTLWNASLTLCFWSLEPEKLERRIKDIAEVDATGRYYTVPWACRGLTMSSRTLLRAYYIYQWRGYLICSVHSTGNLRTSTTNRQMPDTPLFFCRHQYQLFISPILGVWLTVSYRQMNKNHILVASLLLNLLGAIGICGMAYHYRGLIKEKLKVQKAIIPQHLSDNFTQYSYHLKKNNVSINFSFDDSCKQDAQIKDVFDEFGMKCGFAIIKGDERYRQYAEEGFEILAHNKEPLADATEAEIRSSMIQGKSVVESLGLICHGWVTPSSTLNPCYVATTNDYFEYGFTIYKGADKTGLTIEKNSKSYNLWRAHISVLKDNLQSIIADAIDKNGMVSVYGHGYELTETPTVWTLEDLRTILTYCKKNNIEVLTPYQSCLKLFSEKHNDY